ncbi:MAG: hypothetical protein HGA67_04055 [Candidatus Yonathbacteria bacterium]|nr:hypothetical protein [Candidatus Yonathbacteria bacterium]
MNVNFKFNISDINTRLRAFKVTPQKAHTHPRRDWYILLITECIVTVVLNGIVIGTVSGVRDEDSNSVNASVAYTLDRTKLASILDVYRKKDVEFTRLWEEGIIATDPSY